MPWIEVFQHLSNAFSSPYRFAGAGFRQDGSCHKITALNLFKFGEARFIIIPTQYIALP